MSTPFKNANAPAGDQGERGELSIGPEGNSKGKQSQRKIKLEIFQDLRAWLKTGDEEALERANRKAETLIKR